MLWLDCLKNRRKNNLLKPASKTAGLILIGHGSKLPHNRENLEKLAEIIRLRKKFQTVSIAFMIRDTPTVEEAIDNAVPMPVISASLFARFASRQPVSPALQAVAALRGQFGGHAVMTIAEGEKLRATVPETAGAKASPGQATATKAEAKAAPKAAPKAAKRAVKAAPTAP